MLDNIDIALNTDSDKILKIMPATIEESSPSSVTLKKKKNGEYVLVGAYKWWCGEQYGVNYRELETIIEE